jgi:hypothetical protein
VPEVADALRANRPTRRLRLLATYADKRRQRLASERLT